MIGHYNNALQPTTIIHRHCSIQNERTSFLICETQLRRKELPEGTSWNRKKDLPFYGMGSC